jgi:hypothetical protein
VSELAEQIVNLKDGDHLCLFYHKDPVEQMPALIPFIQEALAKQEQFIYIADDLTVEELVGHLRLGGIDVGKHVDRGALKLWTRREWRQSGKLSSQKKSRQVLDFLKAAADDGFAGVRFAVEMTWTLGPDIDPADLEHWEASINELFSPGSRRRIVCQYNRSRLSPEALLVALHTHPVDDLGQSRVSQLVLRSAADSERQIAGCARRLYDVCARAQPGRPPGTSRADRKTRCTGTN